MDLHNVKIEMDGPGRGKVFLDHEELKGVRSISFRGEVDEVNSVSIEMLVDHVFVNADAVDITDIGSDSILWRTSSLWETFKALFSPYRRFRYSKLRPE